MTIPNLPSSAIALPHELNTHAALLSLQSKALETRRTIDYHHGAVSNVVFAKLINLYCFIISLLYFPHPPPLFAPAAECVDNRTRQHAESASSAPNGCTEAGSDRFGLGPHHLPEEESALHKAQA